MEPSLCSIRVVLGSRFGNKCASVRSISLSLSLSLSLRSAVLQYRSAKRASTDSHNTVVYGAVKIPSVLRRTSWLIFLFSPILSGQCTRRSIGNTHIRTGAWSVASIQFFFWAGLFKSQFIIFLVYISTPGPI
jgi:hypothetical protein